jgi:hypothetical protein
VDPVTLLWIFSLLGAAGFAATGYWYGRMKAAEEVAAAKAAGASDVHRATTVPPPNANANAAGEAAEALEKMKAQARAAAIEEASAEKAAAIEAASREADERLAAQRAELEAAFADEKAAAEDALHQISALREELRVEILARTEAERRSADLTSRLVSSSQQVAALRAKAGLTPEAPAVRASSLTPPAPRVSNMPPSMSPQRMQSLAPGLFGELEDLRREVDRLKRENETLRVAHFVKRQD